MDEPRPRDGLRDREEELRGLGLERVEALEVEPAAGGDLGFSSLCWLLRCSVGQT